MSIESTEPSKIGQEPEVPDVVAPEPAAPGRLGAVGLQGHVDAIVSGRVYGWAWNPEAPGEHVSVDIHHKGALVGQTIANRFRQDLADLQMADGTHAFVFDLPSPEREADGMAIAAYFSETGVPLSRGASGQLPQAGTRRNSVELLSGRIDRMEASLQQIYRALHFFRSREEQLSSGPISSEVELLVQELAELRTHHGSLAEQIDVLARETNSTVGLVERIEVDIQTRASRSEVDFHVQALTRRIITYGATIILVLVVSTIVSLHLLELL